MYDRNSHAVYQAQYPTEADASQLLRTLFKEQGWTVNEQYRTPSGVAIDFVIEAWQDDERIVFGVECKRQLSMWSEATRLADHLEQAAAYSRELDIPVFVGPFVSNSTPSSSYTGGAVVQSMCAFNIFGGRMNVGSLIVSPLTSFQKKLGYTPNWFMILRGSDFWQRGKFNKKRLNMVCSTGSKKQRRSINDSQNPVVVFGSKGLQELPKTVQRSQSAEAVCKETNPPDDVRYSGPYRVRELRQGRDSTPQELRDLSQAVGPAEGDGWD
jgi:hypothetical protein